MGDLAIAVAFVSEEQHSRRRAREHEQECGHAPSEPRILATSETGQTISALVSADAQGDLAKGACYNDTAVEVEAWPN